MNKTLLRNFAIQARVRLMKDVAYRLGLMGITAKGILPPAVRQTGMEAYEYSKGEQFKLFGADIEARSYLAEEARAKGFDQLVEEVAYTWFNRLIAIRFMEVNDYLPTHTRVLSSVTPGQSVPDIVTHALDIDLGLTAKEKEQVLEWKLGSKVDPLFRFLFLKQCDQLSKILPGLFVGYRPASSYSTYDNPSAGSVGFTEDPYKLLLTLSCIDPDGLVAGLLEIPEDYFNVSARNEEGQPAGQVEIIGWMYQFYNTELKDETFEQLKKNVKIPKERIPAATQLFTPHWIVRYMVENSLGRLWVEKLLAQGDRRSEADIAKAFGWDYYLPEAEQPPEVQETLKEQRKERASLHLEDIRVLDPCMGSGHILVYAFDVLMQLYLSSGYTQRDAAKLIVEKNLWGIDIDERAWQLSHFALLMKARQYNRQALNTISFTHLYPVRDTRGWSRRLLDYIAGGDNAMRDDLDTLKATYAEAETLGSIIRPPAVDSEKLYEHWRGDILGHYHPDIEGRILQQQTETHFLPVLLQHRALEQKYHVVVTNPPYMGSSGMNNLLSSYVKEEYPDSKSDLFAVFMEKGLSLTESSGFTSMVTMQSWMFLSSFERLRKHILANKTIQTLMHMENMVLGIAFGTAVTIMRNSKVSAFIGTYNLIKMSDIEQNEPKQFPIQGNRFAQVPQHNFSKIPGSPVAYWASQTVFSIFSQGVPISKYLTPKEGLTTGDNDTFIRLWHEVGLNSIRFNLLNQSGIGKSSSKWFPFNKGGERRDWYGNYDFVVNWEDEGDLIKMTTDVTGKRRASVRNEPFYFMPAITWGYIASGRLSFRYRFPGSVHDVNGKSAFIVKADYQHKLLGLLNSIVSNYLFGFINSTYALQNGDFAVFPIIEAEKWGNEISSLTIECIDIARKDWDSLETSWNFNRHPMV